MQPKGQMIKGMIKTLSNLSPENSLLCFLVACSQAKIDVAEAQLSDFDENWQHRLLELQKRGIEVSAGEDITGDILYVLTPSQQLKATRYLSRHEAH